jgi:hypothetical protein
VFFGPGSGNPPTYRFDSASSRFGVSYVGSSRVGAMAETLLRNQQRLMVAMLDITDSLACGRALLQSFGFDETRMAPRCRDIRMERDISDLIETFIS